MVEFKPFSCKTEKCEGTLSPESSKEIFMRVSCSTETLATYCPICGRIYWLDGNPVRNRRYQAAFVNKENIVEHRPMLAHEKEGFVKELIEYIESDIPCIQKTLTQDNLIYLTNEGHTTDCQATTGGECSCGTSNAEKWLAKHSSSSEE